MSATIESDTVPLSERSVVSSEPVTFVQRIRHYYNILAYNELMANRRQPPLDVARLLPEEMRSPVRLAAL